MQGSRDGARSRPASAKPVPRGARRTNADLTRSRPPAQVRVATQYPPCSDIGSPGDPLKPELGLAARPPRSRIAANACGRCPWSHTASDRRLWPQSVVVERAAGRVREWRGPKPGVQPQLVGMVRWDRSPSCDVAGPNSCEFAPRAAPFARVLLRAASSPCSALELLACVRASTTYCFAARLASYIAVSPRRSRLS